MSKCFVVYRHVNGISLNPREYILDESNEVFKFRTKVQILEKLNAKNEQELEEQGIYIEEENTESFELMGT